MTGASTFLKNFFVAHCGVGISGGGGYSWIR